MYDVAPFLTDVGEFTPPELKIPAFFIVQPIVVEYSKEYLAVERIHRCIKWNVFWLLGCWW